MVHFEGSLYYMFNSVGNNGFWRALCTSLACHSADCSMETLCTFHHCMPNACHLYMFDVLHGFVMILVWDNFAFRIESSLSLICIINLQSFILCWNYIFKMLPMYIRVFDLLCFVASSCIPYELVEREIGHPLCERWRGLAFALGFSKKEVYHITSTYGRSNLDCMCEGVIKTWLNRNPFKWETMLVALEDIGEEKRAKQLRMKYVEGTVVPHHQSMEDTKSVHCYEKYPSLCYTCTSMDLIDPGLTLKVVDPIQYMG